MKLLIAIINYKTADLTVDCLRSIAPQVPNLPLTRVAVCENGSGPDQATTIQNAIEQNGWDWASLTVAPTNLGFTGGNNLIIEPTLASDDPPEYTLLLNNDTVVQPGALQALLDYMDANPKVGIVGPQLTDPPAEGSTEPAGATQHSAFRFHSVFSEFDRGLRLGLVSKLLKNHLVCPSIPTEPGPTDWVSGAALLIRLETLQDTGPLDTDYFTYFEDTDLCHTAKTKGWPTHYLPYASIIHYGGMSTGIDNKQNVREPRRPDFWFQARRRFFLKSKGALGAALADGAYLLGATLFKIHNTITRKHQNDPPHLYQDAWRHSVFLTGFKLNPVPHPNA
ncbi:MAG: glycosyltransferase family 2 protein [Planctomycetota bacterium]|jgi:GT2 family glycosyltransferase